MSEAYQFNEEVVEETRKGLKQEAKNLDNIAAELEDVANSVRGVEYYDAAEKICGKITSLATKIQQEADKVTNTIGTLDELEKNVQANIKANGPWANFWAGVTHPFSEKSYYPKNGWRRFGAIASAALIGAATGALLFVGASFIVPAITLTVGATALAAGGGALVSVGTSLIASSIQHKKSTKAETQSTKDVPSTTPEPTTSAEPTTQPETYPQPSGPGYETQEEQQTDPQTEAPTTAPETETPTISPTTPPEDDNGTVTDSTGTGGNNYAGEGMDFDADTNSDDVEFLDDIDNGEDLSSSDSIITIPTTIKGTTTKSTNKSSAAVPVLGALGVAAAAGIGAKIYMDNRINNQNSDDENYDEDENSNINADKWNEDSYSDNSDDPANDSNLSFDSKKIDDLEQGIGEI